MKVFGKLIVASFLLVAVLAVEVPVNKVDGLCIKVPNKKLLPNYIYSDESHNTPEKCKDTCSGKGYKFAGVKWSKECWCGNTEPPMTSYTAATDCNMPCSGDKTLMCGGGHTLNLYKAAKREVDKSDGACLEVPNKTLLPYYIYSKSTNTPSLCTAACAEMGYRFAGVKWSTECWCGDTEPPSSSYTAPAQCNMPCAGDQKIMCGAGSVLNLYRKNTAEDDFKKAYLALKNDGSDEYTKKVKKMLPRLLELDLLKTGEVGIALKVTEKNSDYPPLALLTGEGVETIKPEDQVVTINGTVTTKIGKRSYTAARVRPTGLYAPPGEIISISIPTTLVGKIGVSIGQDEIVKVWFNPLTKDVNKIASPFGGLIIVYLKDYEATTKEKMFDVKIDNAVLAPHFSLGINSNMDWNKMKKYSPPFAVLRVPGQMHIYMQTKHLQGVTDMEALLKNWKVTLDILDSLLGIPLNLQPGEEQLHYNPSIGGGNRYHVCDGGGKSRVDADYWKGFVDYKRKHPTVVFHELGHGYCYSDMPDMGGQWTAELVREYIEKVRGYDNLLADQYQSPFSVLHQMVSFSKLSKGETCGVAKFPAGADDTKTSWITSDYNNCWTLLWRLPLWEFGWDVLRKVLSSDALSTTVYSNDTDRMVDLFCKETKSNLIPMFKFYNIDVSPSIAEPCQKQKAPVQITNYINIANCIMTEDIMKCAKRPEFPTFKGICRLSGVCNKHPDQEGRQVILEGEFDLWGAANAKGHKKGKMNTAMVEKNCHGRAEEAFRWCGNENNQKITASFTLKDGVSSSESFPYSGNCYETRLSHYAGSSPGMTPEKCNEMCDQKSYQYFGVRYTNECWCADAMPSMDKQKPMTVCDMPCSGDSSRNCGGTFSNNVWNVCKENDNCTFSYV